MTKKVTFVTGYPFSEVVIANRLTPLMEAFHNVGWVVDLITPSTTDQINHVNKKVSVSTFPYKHPDNKIRLIFEILNFFILHFHLRCKMRSKTDQTTLVFITIPSIFLIFCICRKKNGVKYVCDIRDITWEYVLRNRINLLSRLIRKVFTRSLLRFDFITVTNLSEYNYVTKIGVPPEKVFLLSNGLGRDKFGKLESLYTPLKISQSTTFFYSGNVGKAQNLEFLLENFSSVTSGSRIEIVGSGMFLKKLQDQYERHRGKNIRFYGFMPWKRMVKKCFSADVLVVSLGLQYKSAVPSKVYEYLAMKKPLLYVGPRGACSELLGCFENIFFVFVEDPDASKQLSSLIVDQSWLKHQINPDGFDRNLTKVKENFIRDDICHKFAKMFAA